MRRIHPHPILLLGSLLLLLTLVAAGPAAAGKAPKRSGAAKGSAAKRVAVHHQIRLGARTVACPSSRRARLNLIKAARRAKRQGMKARYRTLRRKQAAASKRQCTQPAPPKFSPAPGSIYWGGWISKQLTGEEAPWDMNAVAKFEEMAGKKLSLVHFASPFSNCYESSCYFYDFPTDPMDDVREHGAIPFFSWSSQSIPSNREQPDYQLADVARGDYDEYIREFAADAAAWGHPFFLRFNWEMNGDWFSWGVGANGNTSADYVAAWHRVHDIFTSEGATNATWVWCPNVDPGGTMGDLGPLYPGDSYVDWTCLDGYNFGTHPNSPVNAWASVDELFRSTYDEIVGQIAPSKPMIIGETGASEHGGSKAAWISELLSKIPTEYPQVRGLLWFEKFDDGMDWPLETSTSAVSAFAAGIQSPAFAVNSYGGLSTSGPIPPPAG